jgi:hypothetical protein
MRNSRDLFGENLTEQAYRAYTLARECCPGGSDGCLDFHILYPFLRTAGLVGGVEADRAQLVPVLAALAENGVRRWLVPGAADSGILATIAQAVGALGQNEEGERARQEHRFTLLDICPTPLALNREYADSHALHLETLCRDLGAVDFEPASFDAIVGHMVLTFLPPERQVATLRAMTRWLHPERGRLIITMRFGEQEPTTEMAERLVAHRTRTLLEMRASSVLALPEAEDDFVARIDRQGRSSFSQWESNLATQEDVVALLEAAGFVVEQMQMRASERHRPVGWPDGPARPRLVIVARPSH